MFERGRWCMQEQVRRGTEFIRLTAREYFYGDSVADEISHHLAQGWTIDRNDSISVTMRSPIDAHGEYRFRHYWREGR